ncbi:MAG: ABC transporter permease [Aigarchaeota archaeon]|nr:ABC transporter permease [Aigarchaeota archaeon]MDW8093108.1 ABC transporter permease [Nitrososphaerota archaeon]
MSIGRVLSVLIEYELRSSLARKRVVILLATTFLLEIGVYFVLTRLPASFIDSIRPYAWVVGLIAPSTVLLHVLGLTIGSSTSAEEYETGTADFWFTRPMSRFEYFTGKVIGGFMLLVVLIFSYSFIALSVSWYVFGPQQRVDLFMNGLVSSVFSALPFYLMGIAFGELIRRGMVATIVAGTTFFGCVIYTSYANFIAVINNDGSLLDTVKLLPTWGATNIPISVVSEQIDTPQLRLFIAGPLGISDPGLDLSLAAINVVAYSLLFFSAAFIRFRYSDVTRRAQ